MNAAAVDAAAAWMIGMVRWRTSTCIDRRILYIETGDRQTLLRLVGVDMTFAFAVQRGASDPSCPSGTVLPL